MEQSKAATDQLDMAEVLLASVVEDLRQHILHVHRMEAVRISGPYLPTTEIALSTVTNITEANMKP